MNLMNFRPFYQSVIGKDCARLRVFKFAPKRVCGYNWTKFIDLPPQLPTSQSSSQSKHRDHSIESGAGRRGSIRRDENRNHRRLGTNASTSALAINVVRLGRQHQAGRRRRADSLYRARHRIRADRVRAWAPCKMQARGASAMRGVGAVRGVSAVRPPTSRRCLAYYRHRAGSSKKKVGAARMGMRIRVCARERVHVPACACAYACACVCGLCVCACARARASERASERTCDGACARVRACVRECRGSLGGWQRKCAAYLLPASRFLSANG